jgi:hypothetical protein
MNWKCISEVIISCLEIDPKSRNFHVQNTFLTLGKKTFFELVKFLGKNVKVEFTILQEDFKLIYQDLYTTKFHQKLIVNKLC